MTTTAAVKVKAVDAVCNLRTPEAMASKGPEWGGFLGGKIPASQDTLEGVGMDELIARMDAAGIEKALLLCTRTGSKYHGFSNQLSYEYVADIVQKYPDRFRALAGLDPWEGMEGVRNLEHAVKELGFVGAHLYPHWFRMAPDHRKYYPFYAKCIELDIPIQMQVGHCLIYRDPGTMPPLESVGRPILLDTIACDLPELKLIGIHTGWPWVEEMISVAWKHPNVYIGSDAYAPSHWKPEFVQFINTWGRDKVIFGTDFPVIDQGRAMREIDDLELKPESKRKFLRENLLRVYNLQDW